MVDKSKHADIQVTISRLGKISADSITFHLKRFLFINPYSANHDCSRRHSKIFFSLFLEKIRLDVSSEASARQRIHMKNQALLSSKDKSKTLICRLLQFLFGTLRVKRVTKSYNLLRKVTEPHTAIH